MSSANRPFEPFDPNHASSDGAAGQTPVPALPCDELLALLPAYSIGATDREEAAAIQLHLQNCPDATTDLAAYASLAEALLYTTPRQPPPARLATALRTAIGVPVPAAPAPKPVKPVKRSPFTLVPLPPPKPPRRWAFGRIGATAAVLLLLLLNGVLLVQNQQLRVQQAALATALEQQNRALIFLAAEEPQEVILPAVQENSEAQADILWNDSLGVAVVYVRAFPVLPSDMAYQLWLREGEERTSAGLFTVDEQGMGLLVFPIERALDAYDAMGITPEPAGGSPGPTAPAVVRRQFSN
ncbi:MAG: anti-sigma factor [Caldilineaceae bacterium]|nr:anti-sigma factor [Caldilineaceae bacterium]